MRSPHRVLVTLLAGLLGVGSVACVDTSKKAGAPVVAPDIGAALRADGPPPEDPPADLLVEQRATRQADRLLEKTRQIKEFCEAMVEIDAIEEPLPHDVAELQAYVARYLGVVQTVKQKSQVRNPDDPDDEIDLPEEMWKDVQTLRSELYAYSVRIAFIGGLRQAGRIGDEEATARLDKANVALATSDYTEAERRLIALRPRYCA